jgi:rubrerythrin
MKNRLKDMMKDEKKAPSDYYKLIKQVRGKRNKDVLRGIIKQERSHLVKLKKIKVRLQKK